MPLIKCIDCGKEHSDIAAACPNCGRPNKSGNNTGNKDRSSPVGSDKQKSKNVFFQSLGFVVLLTTVVVTYGLWTRKDLLLTSSDTKALNAETPERPKPPPGWSEMEIPGVYFDVCSSSGSIPECQAAIASMGDNKGLAVRFWCKERACGDIYIEANQLSDSGGNMGFTNDTAHGDLGDVVYLTLESTNQNTGSDEDSDGNVFAFPAISKVTMNGQAINGFPIGIGKP